MTLHRPRASAAALVTAALLLSGAAALGPACVAPPPSKRAPLGLLPSAVTTAEPEWLPFGIRVGEVREPEPREAMLRDLRRIAVEGDATFVAWAPGSRKLVYEETLGRNTRVVVVDLETRKTNPFAAGSREARRPRFVSGASDRLTVLLRAEDASSGFSLVSSALDGSGLSVLAGPDLDPSDAISTGEAVVFVGADGGERAIYVREGAIPATVAVNAPGDESDLAVSPDGSTVVWTQRKANRTALVAAAFPEMTRHQRTITPDDVLAAQASFLPDSRTLVFSSVRDAAARELYVTTLDAPRDANGSPTARRLTFAPHGSEAPAVSPDGAFIAFVSAREGGGKKDVYIARWSSPE